MTRALQKLIHVACRELRIASEDRRALQLEVCGKESMADMNEADMTAVLDRLKKSGFKVQPARGRHPRAPRADLRLVHVLWRRLGDAGVLRDPSRDGLNAFVRTRFGNTWGAVPADIDMLRDAGQINAVARALKDWGRREDIDFDFDGPART